MLDWLRDESVSLLSLALLFEELPPPERSKLLEGDGEELREGVRAREGGGEDGRDGGLLEGGGRKLGKDASLCGLCGFGDGIFVV